MRVRLFGNAVLSAFLFLLLFLLPLPASADVLDQVHFYPHHANWSQWLSGGPYWAQVYTAGITGTLTGVNVNLWPLQNTYPLQVSIYTVAAGTPTWAVLGTTTLGVGQPNGQDTFIPIPGSVGQVAGTQYAIVLAYPNAQGGTLGLWTGSWPGHDVYPRGQAWYAPSAGGTWSTWDAWADLHFRTYVEPVPEPATLLLVGTGLAGICLKRRTR